MKFRTVLALLIVIASASGFAAETANPAAPDTQKERSLSPVLASFIPADRIEEVRNSTVSAEEFATLVGIGMVDSRDDQLIESMNRIESAYFGGNSERNKVIYGTDDRVDFHQIESVFPDPAPIVASAKATALITFRSRVKKTPDNRMSLSLTRFEQTLSAGSYGNVRVPACANEPYAQQLVGGICSGFLVSPSLLVTAGHCIRPPAKVTDLAVIFGFYADTANTQISQFDSNRVYYGAELIAQSTSPRPDFAIIRLDRQVPSEIATPFDVGTSPDLKLGDLLGAIGYPSGLPLKVAFGAESKVIGIREHEYEALLDTYQGNSGSPVVSQQNPRQVVGILVRGQVDYVLLDSNNSCFRSHILTNRDRGEQITNIRVLQPLLQQQDSVEVAAK